VKVIDGVIIGVTVEVEKDIRWRTVVWIDIEYDATDQQ